MYEAVNFDVVWRKYRENPHIEYNSETLMYRCKTCKIKLNTNPGGAGKHSTKIHNLMLSGKTVKKKIEKLPEITNDELFDHMTLNISTTNKMLLKIQEKLDAINAHNKQLEEQNYFLSNSLDRIKSTQSSLSLEFEKLKKANTNVIDFVKFYVIFKAANDGNLG